jgi:hypothetical protein
MKTDAAQAAEPRATTVESAAPRRQTERADPPSLGYATPWPRHAWAPSAPAQRLFWGGVRKVILAGGAGLVVYAATSVAGDVNRHAAPVAAAWGVAFVVMMLPVRFERRRKMKRRRRHGAPGDGAAATPTSGI